MSSIDFNVSYVEVPSKLMDEILRKSIQKFKNVKIHLDSIFKSENFY